MHSLVAAGLVCWYFSFLPCKDFQNNMVLSCWSHLLSSLEGLGIQRQMTTNCGRWITRFSLASAIWVATTSLYLVCTTAWIQCQIIQALAGRSPSTVSMKVGVAFLLLHIIWVKMHNFHGYPLKQGCNILLQNVRRGNLHQIEHFVHIADQLFGWATSHVLLHTIALRIDKMK